MPYIINLCIILQWYQYVRTRHFCTYSNDRWQMLVSSTLCHEFLGTDFFKSLILRYIVFVYIHNFCQLPKRLFILNHRRSALSILEICSINTIVSISYCLLRYANESCERMKTVVVNMLRMGLLFQELYILNLLVSILYVYFLSGVHLYKRR